MTGPPHAELELMPTTKKGRPNRAKSKLRPDGSYRMSAYFAPDEVAEILPQAEKAGLSLYQYIKLVTLAAAREGRIPRMRVTVELGDADPPAAAGVPD